MMQSDQHLLHSSQYYREVDHKFPVNTDYFGHYLAAYGIRVYSSRRVFIKKSYLYNFDPLKPHFYIVKLGFTGVYIFFISAQKHRSWVPVRTASSR